MVTKNLIGSFASEVFYCLLFLFFSLPTSALAEPFQTTDQNPFSLVNGLPLPVAAKLPAAEATAYHFALEITNTLNSQTTATESILLDFEGYHLKTGFSTGLKNNWAFKANLSLLYRGNGTFDESINDWHQFFGLPEGKRPSTANNQYQIQYIKNSNTAIDLTQSQTDIADIQLSIGKQLLSHPKLTTSVWSTIELPVGDNTNLTGNKGVDVSLYLATNSVLNSQWNVFSNIGLLVPGKSIHPALESASQVWFGHLGSSWVANDYIELQVQFNAHSNMYENSKLRLLNDTVEFIFGGTIKINSCSTIDIAFSEDIKVAAAPDFSLMVDWRGWIGGC